MVPLWFEPTISREAAELKLQSKHTGNFLIRQSSQPGTLALSVKTGRNNDDIQHFIIISRDGSVALEDSNLEFDSLVSLVHHYSSNRDELPVSLKMMESTRKSSAPAGYLRSDSPYVSMAGRQRTKSTIWVNSPVFRSSPSNTATRDLEVIQSVLQQGSSMQDQFSSLLTECLSNKHEFDKLNQEIQQSDLKDDNPIVKEDDIQEDDIRKKLEDEEYVDESEEEDYCLPVDIQTNLYEVPEEKIVVKTATSISSVATSRLSPQTFRLSPQSPSFHNSTSKSVPETSPREKSLGLDSKTNIGKVDSNPNIGAARPAPRYRKNNSVVENHFRPAELQIPANISKSCSDIFQEMERINNKEQQFNKNFRKSFVRKVSLNLSARRNNNVQPIRKISNAMKKMFPVPKAFSSLVNSQENSDSWEYLADCGISPVYEEVKEPKKPVLAVAEDFYSDVTETKDSFEEKMASDRLCFRSGSCDSLYESEYSISTPSSIDRLKPNQDTQAGNTTAQVQQLAGNPPTAKERLAGNSPPLAGNQQRRKLSEPIRLLGAYQSPESTKSPDSIKSPESPESPESPPRRRPQDNVTRIRVGGAEQKTPRNSAKRLSRGSTVLYV